MSPYHQDLITKHAAALAMTVEGSDLLRSMIGQGPAQDLIMSLREIGGVDSDQDLRKQLHLVRTRGDFYFLRHPIPVNGSWLWLKGVARAGPPTEFTKHALFLFDRSVCVGFMDRESAEMMAKDVGATISREVRDDS